MSTWSACLKASRIATWWSVISSSLSLGMTMRVSTSSRSAAMPFSAWVERRLPSKLNGPGHDADGQRAQRAGDARHDRGTAGAGAAALARGDEDHVGALEHLFDLVGVVLGGLTALVGVGAGAEAAGQVAADVELDVGVAHQQRLGVGVHRDELDAAQTGLDHAVDGVDAAAADADDLDDRQVVLGCTRHVGFPFCRRPCRQCYAAPSPRRSREWEGNDAVQGCWDRVLGGRRARRPTPPAGGRAPQPVVEGWPRGREPHDQGRRRLVGWSGGSASADTSYSRAFTFSRGTITCALSSASSALPHTTRRPSVSSIGDRIGRVGRDRLRPARAPRGGRASATVASVGEERRLVGETPRASRTPSGRSAVWWNTSRPRRSTHTYVLGLGRGRARACAR